MRHHGFTLIELLVTIAVMVIIATIAVPGFQNMMISNRLASDYNEVLTGLNLARSEAIKRRETVDFIVVNGSVSGYQIKVGEKILRERLISSGIAGVEEISFSCRVPDDQMSLRSYPLLAARGLLQQFIREQVHGHQAS